ncbi:hypothetical protein SAMN03159343_3960 [Klenkia marina]|uniref:Uncharacterized protein n=1 Tax=Klenkia marina TaxID=1960309 RepID=A0A1G4Z1L4_9ACTN|nr:hypothetical protein [Klenkia marina]SCX59577.1 hypothetical protein SAMN03159343_3960 [Klenkia marina]
MIVDRALTALLAAAAVTAVALTGCSSGSSTSPEADVPQLEAGLVTQQSYVYGLGETPSGEAPNGAHLITPHTHQQLLDVQVTDVLDQSTASLLGLGSGSDTPRAAPEGADVVVASLSVRDLSSPFETGETPLVFELVVGEQRTPVPGAFGEYSYAGAPSPGFWLSPDMTLVVVAPEDQPVWFAVTDEGRTARMDLRTGTLSDDADTAAGLAYYSGRFGDLGGASGSAAGTATDLLGQYAPVDVTVGLSYAERGFTLSPWLPGQGWVAAGRLWGSVFADLELTGQYAPAIGVTTSSDQVFGLAGADGAVMAPLPESVEVSGTDTFGSLSGTIGVGAVWDLPADFAGGTLTTSLDGAWTVLGNPATFTGAPVTVAPVAFTVPR